MPKVWVSTVHFSRFVVALRKRLVDNHGWSKERAAEKVIEAMPFLLEEFKRPKDQAAADHQVDGMAVYLMSGGT